MTTKYWLRHSATGYVWRQVVAAPPTVTRSYQSYEAFNEMLMSRSCHLPLPTHTTSRPSIYSWLKRPEKDANCEYESNNVTRRWK